ncbi:ShlB/FhaC/HecB family hemolysin secretion/activation protein [Pseudomonas sp. 2023EL-01195]|uniref:ShlB/FhaC/HecB family hemolysin secretion/activation protein n=1 Tax=Pseudomonas sp. 2023EL-01195 TaxID=3088134 RepID=UPI00296B2A47|nr:ShlB/FhaC/HecB family hemolysin secretion/activation protein [Pseudomonas sp. 2023EL-01195]MDW3716588.1 ShlB/FhaC/HecB family hemolysin secretion/activation protein [Pseudomonas sp. 2023EL-01195]
MKKLNFSLPRAFFVGFCAVLLGSSVPTASWSAPLPTLDPGRVQVPDANGMRSSPSEMPGTLELPPSTVTADQPRLRDVTPAEPELKTDAAFAVSRVVLDGVTSYPLGTFRSLLVGLEGRRVTLAEVNGVAGQITQRYRQAGFLLARTLVPAQRLEGGELHIKVIEGRVNQVNIQGPSSSAMQRYARNIEQEVPIKGETLERNLLLMNDLPGNEAHGTLSASQGREGTDLDIHNEQRRVEGFIGFDNRDSRYFGPWQGYGGIGINDLTGIGDHLSLRYGRSLEGDKMAFYEGQYELPVGGQGTMLSFLAQHNDGRADTWSVLNANSSGDTLAIRLTHPWVRSRAETFKTSLAFSWYNGRSEYLDEPDLAPSSDDRIRALRLGASWDYTDGYGGRNLFKGELSQGLDVLGASSEQRANPSRVDGQTDFTRLQLDAQRIQDLSWITSGLNLYLAVSGQTSFGDALLTPEQFGVGGSQFGRGYDPSEIAGDNGLAGKVELQYNRQHQIGDYSIPTQYYAYWDIGKVWNEKPRDISSESLASAGLGVHLQVAPDMYVSPELAFPLTRSVSAEELDGDNGKEPRLYLNFIKLF